MKKFLVLLVTVLGLVGSVRNAEANARVQFIHNASDTLLKTVDIWVSGLKQYNDFKYRTATPFSSVPAGFTLALGIAPGNSTKYSDVIKTVAASLVDGHVYYVILQGVDTTRSFLKNPDGRSISLDLKIIDGAFDSASNASNTDIRIFHGITDLGKLNFRFNTTPNSTFNKSSLSYNDTSEELTLPATKYVIDIYNGAKDTTYATYEGDFTSYDGKGILLITSGFSNGKKNQGGPNADLYAVLPDGSWIKLNQVYKANLQLIQAAADTATTFVDVYINGVKVTDPINGFSFASATTYLTVPCNQTLQIAVTKVSSIDTAGALLQALWRFEPYVYHALILSGLKDVANYHVNPQGKDLHLKFIHVIGGKKGVAGKLTTPLVNTVTDLPVSNVDVKELTPKTLWAGTGYGATVSPAISWVAKKYNIDIVNPSTSVVLKHFNADLSGYADSFGIMVFAGFLDDSAVSANPLEVMIVFPNSDVLIFLSSVGQKEIAYTAKGEFTVFPNPATNYVNVKFTDKNIHLKTAEITTVSGTKLASYNNQNSIDVSQLPNGMYLLTLRTDNGSFTSKLFVN